MIFVPLLVCLGALPWPSESAPSAAGPSTWSASVSATRSRAAVVQDAEDDAIVDKRPEVKALVAKFSGFVSKKGQQDAQAIEVVDSFLQEFPNSGPKDRADMVKALEKAFSKTRRDIEEGVPNDGLFRGAAAALGEMGPESVKPLIGLIDTRKHRSNLDLRRQLILALGRTKDERGVKPLLNLLGHKDPIVEGASAESLGNYEDAEQKTRKEICKELLKVLAPLDGQVRSDPAINDEIQRRYDTVSGPMVQTLGRVTGHDERDPQMWLRWWNNHKKDDWDADDA